MSYSDRNTNETNGEFNHYDSTGWVHDRHFNKKIIH